MRTAKKQNIALINYLSIRHCSNKLFIHQEQRHQQQLDEDIRMARISQVLKTNTVHQQQQEHHRRTTEIDQHQQNVASDLITPVILERATASMRVSPPQNNFDVLIRVLEEPDYLGGKTLSLSSWQNFTNSEFMIAIFSPHNLMCFFDLY